VIETRLATCLFDYRPVERRDRALLLAAFA
jgi:hypothetical protein